MTTRSYFKLEMGRGATEPRTAILPVLASLHALARGREAFSFDLAAQAGSVAVYLSCPPRCADHLVAQMYAHYSDIILTPCPGRMPAAGPCFVSFVRPAKPEIKLLRCEYAERADPSA